VYDDEEIREIENPTQNNNSSISVIQKNHTTLSNDTVNSYHSITNDTLSSINSSTNYPTYSTIDHSNSSNVDYPCSTRSNIGSNNYSARTNIVIDIDDNDDNENTNEDQGIDLLLLNNENYIIIFVNELMQENYFECRN
jgi:hypothetical protein